MNLKATGAYIWYLREHFGLSRDAVGEAAGTNDVQVMRIEKGDIDTRGSLLFAMIRIVNGNADDVSTLMHDASATVDDGRRLAREWIEHLDEQRSEIEIEDELTEIRDIRARLAQQPTLFHEAFERAVSYLKFLVSERQSSASSASGPAVDKTPEPPKRRRSQRAVPPKAS